MDEPVVYVLFDRRISRRQIHRGLPRYRQFIHRLQARLYRYRQLLHRQAHRWLHRRPILSRREIQPSPVQILALGIHAVDLPRASSQERHEIIAMPPRKQAAGSQGGEIPGFRPLADGHHRALVRPIDRRRPRERAYEWGERYS
jgi:hypothetical protein